MAVEYSRISLGREAVFVCVATYTCDPFETKVERFRLETGTGEERHKEGTKAAVHMKGKAFAHGKAGERADVINDTVREVWSGANKENGVGVYEARD